MRLTSARIVSQVFFLGLFLFFVVTADLRFIDGTPVSWFLELDPLVGLSTALATREVYRGLLWGLALIALTLLLGRVFCGWMCPFGALHHFVGWLARPRSPIKRAHNNRYRPLYQLKYVILAAMVVAAAFGSVQIGLLDPIVLMHRSAAAAILPALEQFRPGTFYLGPHVYAGAWLIGALFVFFLGLNVLVPRFFCRALCPLGALLGVFSRFALWRIHRSESACRDCNLCAADCEGACDPHLRLRKSECFVCFNCLEDCGTTALSYQLSPPRETELAGPAVPQRRAALGVLIGAAFLPLTRASGDSTERLGPDVIRPPGSVPEPEFLARCIKCDQCLRVCPTNVLQPAALEAGIEGIWTPLMNMQTGYCELNCTLCGQVCPTGAIQRITIPEKRGEGPHADRGPVRIGTAFFDRGRCLPWAMDTPCVVCEEVCPVSPKAIFSREEPVTTRDGRSLVLRRPYLDPTQCIGCGICEHECPVGDKPAVRVTAIGETRAPERGLLLDSAALILHDFGSCREGCEFANVVVIAACRPHVGRVNDVEVAAGA